MDHDEASFVGISKNIPISYTQNIREDLNSFLIKRGELVIVSDGAESSIKILYEVPKGYLFFLTSTTWTIERLAPAGAESSIYRIDDINLFVTDTFPAWDNNILTDTASFPIPLKLVEGRTISIHSGGVGLKTRGTALGYVISKDIYNDWLQNKL